MVEEWLIMDSVISDGHVEIQAGKQPEHLSSGNGLESNDQFATASMGSKDIGVQQHCGN